MFSKILIALLGVAGALADRGAAWVRVRPDGNGDEGAGSALADDEGGLAVVTGPNGRLNHMRRSTPS
jgi:hypothetical protein